MLDLRLTEEQCGEMVAAICRLRVGAAENFPDLDPPGPPEFTYGPIRASGMGLEPGSTAETMMVLVNISGLGFSFEIAIDQLARLGRAMLAASARGRSQ